MAPEPLALLTFNSVNSVPKGARLPEQLLLVPAQLPLDNLELLDTRTQFSVHVRSRSLSLVRRPAPGPP